MFPHFPLYAALTVVGSRVRAGDLGPTKDTPGPKGMVSSRHPWCFLQSIQSGTLQQPRGQHSHRPLEAHEDGHSLSPLSLRPDHSLAASWIPHGGINNPKHFLWRHQIQTSLVLHPSSFSPATTGQPTLCSEAGNPQVFQGTQPESHTEKKPHKFCRCL